MSPSIRIAEIPYLNCAPFYWNFKTGNRGPLPHADFVWIPVAPRALGELARRGEIEVGPLSLVDSFRLEEDFQPLSDLGIAIRNSAKSVLLFSKEPLGSLDGAQVGLTPETSTSSELLRIILSQKYGLKAHYNRGFSQKDIARLMIGDGALKAAVDLQFCKNFPFLYDLGEEWKKWQGLPFVFARWMVKKDLAPRLTEEISQILNESLQSCRTDMRQAVLWYERKTGLRFESALDYLQEFQYHLRSEEEKSISAFRSLLQDLNAARATV